MSDDLSRKDRRIEQDRETLELAAEVAEELASTIYNQLSDTYSPTELQKKLDSLRQLAARLRDMKDEIGE